MQVATFISPSLLPAKYLHIIASTSTLIVCGPQYVWGASLLNTGQQLFSYFIGSFGSLQVWSASSNLLFLGHLIGSNMREIRQFEFGPDTSNYIDANITSYLEVDPNVGNLTGLPTTVSMSFVSVFDNDQTLIVGLANGNTYFYERKACHPDCLTCYGPNSDNCRSCNLGNVLSGSVCVACDKACKTCDPLEPYRCLSCFASQYLTWIAGLQTCTDCILPGYVLMFDSAPPRCKKCSWSCTTCATDTSTCTNCLAGLLPLVDGSCNLCSDGSYINSTTGKCHPCNEFNPGCELCTNGQTCDRGCTGNPLVLMNYFVFFGYYQTNQSCSYCGGGFYRSSQLQCLPCHSSCASCFERATYCTACPADKCLYEAYCDDCGKPGYYCTPMNRCFPCPVGCLNCTSENDCITCEMNFIKDSTGTMCFRYNSLGSYFDKTANSFVKCDASCEDCIDSATKCSNCHPQMDGKYLMLSTYTCSNCPAGWTLTAQDTCEKCDNTCFECTYFSHLCSRCPAGQYLFKNSNNSCGATCPSDGYFIDGSICFRCVATCLTCSGNNTECIDCSPGYYKYLDGNNSCWSKCDGPDEFVDLSSGRCTKCNTSVCSSCSGSDTFCTACPLSSTSSLFQPLYRLNGSCIDDPCDSPGKFTDEGVCLTCGSNCKSCSGKSGSCLTCPANTYLNDTDAKCHICGPGYILQGSNCKPCDSTCRTCSPNPSKCTACYFGYGLSSSYTCVQCGGLASTFINPADQQCRPCDSNCLTCTRTATNCTSCNTGLFLNPTTHICSTCGPGNFIDSFLNCLPCQPPCLTCQTNAHKCIEYFSGVIMSDTNSTASSCGDGFFLTSTTCKKCDVQCRTCIGVTSYCTSCPAGAFLLPSIGKCMACPSGTYLNSTSLSCQPCDPNCNTCIDLPKNCTSCQPSNGFLSTTNYTCSPCGNGFVVGENKHCYPCHPSCLTCSQFFDKCVVCKPGLFLHPGDKCLPCGDGMFVSGSYCRKCNPECHTCSGTASTCLSCKLGFSHNAVDSSCRTTCMNKQLTNLDGTCADCNPWCEACSFISTNCTRCRSDFFVHVGNMSCNYCFEGYFVDVEQACHKCHDNCEKCAGSANNCSLCKPGKYFVEDSGFCDACENGFYLDLTALKCLRCSSNCLTCANESTLCTSCHTGLQLMASNSSCGVCGRGMFVDPLTGQCSVCDAKCASCSIVADNCTECAVQVGGIDGYYFSSENSTCDLCGDGYTVTPEHLCVPCSQNCEKCLLGRPDICTECKLGYHMNLVTQTCEQTCGVGFFLNTSICEPCHPPCSSCSLLAENCTACSQKEVLVADAQGMQTCMKPPSNHYSDASAGLWTNCSSQCLSCEIRDTFCTRCSGLMLPNITTGFCQADCGTGFFEEDGACKACDPICETCSKKASNCTKCSGTNYISVYNETCGACNEGYYNDGSFCHLCDPVCLACSGEATNCTKYPGGECAIGKYMTTSGFCEACSSNCSECEVSASKCTGCTGEISIAEWGYTSFKLVPSASNGTCFVCGKGYFENLKGFCEACSAECRACVASATRCTECTDATLFASNHNFTCRPCGDGFFRDTNGRCFPCDTSVCPKCIGTAVNCTECYGGFFRRSSDNLCVVCGEGYLLDSVNSLCNPCSRNCTRCEGKIWNCTGISGLAGAGGVEGKYLSGENHTLDFCGDGHFLGTDFKCFSCLSPCSKCRYSASVCTACSSGLQVYHGIDMCLPSCNLNDGWYIEKIDSIPYCRRCHEDCKSCQYVDISSCTSCYSGYFKLPSSLNGGEMRCFSGTTPRLMFDTGSMRAHSCDDKKCLFCEGSQSNCVRCIDNYYLLEDTGSCSICGEGYFRVQDRCFKCSSNCKTCTDAADRCTTCGAGKSLSSANHTCVSSCSGQYSIDSDTNRCITCPMNCSTCSNSSTCLSCPEGFILDDVNCKQSISRGKYSLESLPCSSNCANCKESSSRCIECPPGQFVSAQNFTCGPCGDGYFVSSDRLCYNCSSKCSTCLRFPYQCTSCAPGLHLSVYSNICVNCSHSRMYLTDLSSKGRCGYCGPDCSICDNVTARCTKCRDGLYFLADSNVCMGPKLGYFLNKSTNRFDRCDPLCNGCRYSATNCLKCAVGVLFIVNNSCTDCGQGFIEVNSVCYPCSSNCKTCAGSPSSCRSCPAGKILSVVNNTCIDICGEERYFINKLGQCQECQMGCDRCENTTGNCVRSKPGIFSSASDNINMYCTEGYYLNDTDKKCYLCDPKCSTCFQEPTSCIKCAGKSLSWQNNSCSSCGLGYYMLTFEFMRYINYICDKCSPNCRSCAWSAVTCTSCEAGKYLLLNTNECVSACADGFYLLFQGSACRRCASDCLTCAAVTGKCLTCRPGRYLLSNGSCSPCLPSSGFFADPLTKECKKCSPVCKTCILSEKNCTSCIGYYLDMLTVSPQLTCARDCPTGSFVDSTFRCRPCKPSCSKCFGRFDNCTECSAGHFLNRFEHTCSLCETPGYFITVYGECEPCPSTCRTCNHMTGECSSCFFPRKLLDNKTCHDCGTGYFEDPLDGHCYRCDQKCRSCSGTNTTCTTCQPGLVLSAANSTCDLCGPGFLEFNNRCFQCDPSCATCGPSVSMCTSCRVNTTLVSTNFSCVQDFPVGFYSTQWTVDRCDATCRSCFLGNASVCTSCFSNNFLSSTNSSCGVCGPGWFVDSELRCRQCNLNCLTCHGVAANCSKCAAGMHLSFENRTCGECGDGFTKTPDGFCRRCEGNCKTCTETPSNCTSCLSSVYLIKSITENMALCDYCDRIDTFTYLGSCFICSSNCRSCVGTAVNCTSCNGTNIYLRRDLNNICSDVCPADLGLCTMHR